MRRLGLGEAADGITVQQLAARSGVAVSAVHFYEANGLIKSERDINNQRRYPRGMLRRVSIIKVAQRIGIPLVSIRRVFSTLPEKGTPTAADWAGLSARWKDELDDRIAKRTQLRNQLCDCIGCGCLSIEMCQMRNPSDELHEQGPGPHLLEID